MVVSRVVKRPGRGNVVVVVVLFGKRKEDEEGWVEGVNIVLQNKGTNDQLHMTDHAMSSEAKVRVNWRQSRWKVRQNWQ